MKKYLIILGAIFCTIVSLLLCCKQKTPPPPAQPATIAAPNFDSDSAFLYVKAQTDFGPRVPNTNAHSNCAKYLHSKLAQYCDTIFLQSFQSKAYDGTILNGMNLIGSFAPDRPDRILLAAHWDSRHVADHDPVVANRTTPIDGANDGASGVGVLLELARQLAIKKPNCGIDIIFFDLEDYGTPENTDAPEGQWWGLGSQYWSMNQHVPNYYAKYGILLDMVGNRNARFRYEYFSAYYAQDVLAKVWGAAAQLGFGSTFVAEKSNPITDDHYYVNTMTAIRMIDIIHQDDFTGTGFPATWHTLNDNIDNIDKNTLSIVGKTLLHVIYSE